MDIDHYTSLTGKHSGIAMELGKRPQSDWKHIRVILPGDAGADMETYHAFCAKLELARPPVLMIIDNELAPRDVELGDKDGYITKGYYDRRSRVVVTSQKVFEACNDGKLISQYTVAHETGHAARAGETRRGFMEKIAALSAAAATGSGQAYLTKKGFDFAGLTSPRGWEPADGIPIALGAKAALKMARRVTNYFDRQEEFAADAYAAKAMGKDKVFEALCRMTERETDLVAGRRQLDKIRQDFQNEWHALAAQGVTASDEDLRIAFCLYLAERVQEKISLWDIMKDPPYPALSERVKSIGRS